MTGLQTVPYHIAGMGSDIVLLEENFSHSSRDWNNMRLKDLIHTAKAYKCVLNYNQVGTVKSAKLTNNYITILYNAQGVLLIFSMSIL